jgi:hypothetical protein
VYGYEVTRQTGSHMRLTTRQQGEHHVTPDHDPLRIGTLTSVLTAVAEHFQVTRNEIMTELFDSK